MPQDATVAGRGGGVKPAVSKGSEEESAESNDEQSDSPIAKRRAPRVRNTSDPTSTGEPGGGDAAAGSGALLPLSDGSAPWESPNAEQVKLMVQHLSPRGRDDDDTAEIRVGRQYQCPIPPIQPQTEERADQRVGEVVWDPESMPPDRVAHYLDRSATVRHPAEFPPDAALVHLHRCDYDVEAAIDGLPNLGEASLPDVKQLDAWGPGDVLKFEEGVTRFGKDFRKIQIHMERKFPVSMVILYYFARWKKCPNFRVWQGRWKDYNKDECENCGKGGELLCCDGCPAAYHIACCHPPYSSMAGVPDGEWYCMACVLRRDWLRRCQTSLPSDEGRVVKPSSFSHTPDGSLNVGAPFSPAARFIPRGRTPEIEDLAADAETDNDTEGGVDDQGAVPSSRSSASGSAVATVSQQGTGWRHGRGEAARSAAASQESPDIPVAPPSQTSSSAASATITENGVSGDSRRKRTHAGSDRLAPELTSSGDDEVNVGGASGTKPKSRGPGTPTVDEEEQLAVATGAASAATAGGAATGAAARKRKQSTSPVADMGPFLRGEVLAVRADPEEDAVSPFWVCAVYRVRKNDLEATWYETAGGKAMGPGVRMKQLAWRDKVSINAVLCRLRFGGGRGDSKAGSERKPCDPPMTVSMTKQEWDVAIGAKQESEAAETATGPAPVGKGKSGQKKKQKRRR